MNKSISVLGSGWLGVPLARHLVMKGYKVKSSTTRYERLKELSEAGLNAYLVDTKKEIFPDEFFSSETLIINIVGKEIEPYQSLIQKIEDAGIKRVLFVSSTSVYDPQSEPITEETPINNGPMAQVERLFHKKYSFNCTIVRFAGLIGEGRHPGNFFKDDRPIPNPEGNVNMIEREDCIRLIDAIIEQNYWGEIVNGVGSDNRTRREFYTAARLALGKKPPLFIEGEPVEMKKITSLKLPFLLK